MSDYKKERWGEFGGGKAPSSDMEASMDNMLASYGKDLLERIEDSFSHEPFTEDDLREMFGITGPTPETGGITVRIGPKILKYLVEKGYLEFDEESAQYTLIRTKDDLKRGFESLSTDSDDIPEKDEMI